MKSNIELSKMDKEILNALPSPCWILEEELLERNLKILKDIKERADIEILLALKAYSLWHTFDLISEYLGGCCASGLYEARLGREKFDKEVHTYSPAFKDTEIDEISKISNHIVFNSLNQLKCFWQQAKEANPEVSIGLRVNPEYSESPADIYNPCAPYSRLGILADDIDESVVSKIEGLHFHALCEQDSPALEGVLKAFEERFGKWIPRMRWVNFGGGHHITRIDYDREGLIRLLKDFKSRYPHLKIYLEPGEAVGWQTGSLVATVLDIVHNGMDIAILDTSAEAHMPDTVIMPYRADVRYSAEAGVKPYTYRLAGNTCLSGDIMGDYSFDKALEIGDKIIFEDQIHYTMVKATTFNGIKLPDIAILRKNGKVDIVKEFGYDDFLNRVG